MGPKRPRTESRSTPEVARPAASGEGVKSPQTGAAPTAKDSEAPMTTPVQESKNSKAPRENSPRPVREGVLFGEVAQKAFVATEEIFREPPPVAPSPPPALVRDPLLRIEDFVVEQGDPSPSGMVSSPGQATPTGPSTQLPSGSHRSAPIVLDDGKRVPSSRIYRYLFQC